ncbi:MAG: redoxin domain-containing protein [Kofleriaceae bacterium]|nr:redoxin domain-containing protein [Kofleriaceae bacterium]
MQPELEKQGIRVIALSKDTVEEAAIHKKRDGLSLTLLSDVELETIRQYGVEHHKALNFKTGGFTFAGIPLGMSAPSFKTMAIPTSMLIDEKGVIQWIDQSDDYRVRGDDARIRDAVQNVFGS